MNSDELTPVKHPDQSAFSANMMLAALLALLAAGIIYSSMADLGWLITLILIVTALVSILLFSITRPKNVAWRSLRKKFGEPFGETLDRKNFATGRGQLGDYSYFGIRCFGSPSGLEISRIVSFVNPPLFIPWSVMAKIDTFPNLLTGRKDFETDMQAQIVLLNESDFIIEAPWLAEYRQLLPKSVKYRSIKLSKK